MCACIVRGFKDQSGGIFLIYEIQKPRAFRFLLCTNQVATSVSMRRILQTFGYFQIPVLLVDIHVSLGIHPIISLNTVKLYALPLRLQTISI